MSRRPIRAVLLTAFEPDRTPDSGRIPGEFHHWREREYLTEQLAFPTGYRPLHLSDTGVLGCITGVGASRAAASVMALGLDPRFDFTEAYILISGVCGIDPARGSLGSVVLPEYIVDGTLTHELDAREIPSDWPDGFVPIGKSEPYEQPLTQRFNGDDGIVFRLNPELLAQVYELTRGVELLDTTQMAQRRRQFAPASTAHQPPSILRGDELASSTFWHGNLLSQRARAWVDYQTEGRGTYTFTAMEDHGILQSLAFLAAAGQVDFSRVLIVRAASNFDQQRPGISAAESLAETKVATYSAYLPALENAWRVGHRILEALLKDHTSGCPRSRF